MPQTRKKIGFTLGKFAPLHCGHQHMIDAALAEVDHLIILIYDAPETTPIPLTVRSRWIRDLYPTVEVIEVWDGPVITGDTPEILQLHNDHLRSLLCGRELTHFFSNEFYGDHVSRCFGILDRRIDPDRNRFPISATLVRENPFACRQWIHPRVYRDLVANVVLLGAPSTGKTTLAQHLAKIYGTVWMPEYGREYWDLHQVNRRLPIEALFAIAEEHLKREEQLLLDADRYLFTDTNALTTYLFSLHYHNRAEPRLARLADETASRYDVVFLCMPDIPYDATWDRSGDGSRHVFHRQTVDELARRRIPYWTLSGSVADRVGRVESILGRYRKYSNQGELL